MMGVTVGIGTNRPVRRRVVGLTVLMSVGALAVLLCYVIAVATGLMIFHLLAAGLGALSILVLGLLAIRASDRVVDRNDRIATRLNNLTVESGELKSEIQELQRSLAGEQLRMKERTQLLHKDMQTLRRRAPAGFLDRFESDLAVLNDGVQKTLRVAFESAIQLGRQPNEAISDEQAKMLFNDYLAAGKLLQLRPLIEEFDLLGSQSLTTLRHLYKYYRSVGYWELALLVMSTVCSKTGRVSDLQAQEKLRCEIEVFTQPKDTYAELPAGSAFDSTGPILHVVGRVLPVTQTGYTLRTQYTAMAQMRKGLRVAIVAQSGVDETYGDHGGEYTFQGVDYHILPGPRRNEVHLDDWLRQNIEALGSLVLRLRPSVLHAQSDFFNALIVTAVGRQYGIPTVYETRGFWEESWLSRTISANGWDDGCDRLFAMYGTPAAYRLRRRSEESVRMLPDHVFTLAEVMRDHIIDSSGGSIRSDKVSVVPNAVEATNFPVQARDENLADEIGLHHDAITIGYISSMVEYEGIDTLIDAYTAVSKSTVKPLCLLLVGDGDHLEELKKHAEAGGAENIVFTGRVPHEDVLRYYGLIDVFVVPRKKSTVTDLVTPLKPFEAFSTGRAVVLSDVTALREIAEQSGAAETFRAGSSDDLARVLISLINDEDHRRFLGDRAQRWVRNHRSWDANVNEYYRVYKALGFTGSVRPVIDAELYLENMGANPGEIVEELNASELPSLSGWFSIQEIRQSAAGIVDTGWKFSSFAPVKVATLSEWSSFGREHRSWGFHLHAWEFMDPLLREYDETGDQKWLTTAVEIAISWLELHRDAGYEDPMAWYDMSQALRMPRLIALALRASRLPHLRDETAVLSFGIAWHFVELHKERAFNPNNNHGFYTAVSQAHAAKYAWMFPGADEARKEGQERLATMANSQFAVDGVHLEHSPDYHRMLLSSFEKAVKDGLLEDAEIQNRVRRAAHVLGWMVQPDGALVQFGDSPETLIVDEEADSIDPATAYVLSGGRRGTGPSEELAVFQDGGYAFVRSPQPSAARALEECSYLAFAAAFHSRAHKHADDLNLVWFDAGHQILTDAGRFGYGELLPGDSPLRREGFYYSSPERQYVEGTMAHNTLMMDGANQERRSRDPYGAAIGQCTHENGVFDLSGRVQHTDYIHRRRLVFQPGKELLIKDSVFSQGPESREAILWFNIPEEFELSSAGESVVFELIDGLGPLRLTVEGPGRLLRPVRGQTEPLRGWRSRKDRELEPVWSLGFTFDIETRASVETVFRLERDSEADTRG